MSPLGGDFAALSNVLQSQKKQGSNRSGAQFHFILSRTFKIYANRNNILRLLIRCMSSLAHLATTAQREVE